MKNKVAAHAAARMGINPTPTVAECCKSLIINVLHRMSV